MNAVSIGPLVFDGARFAAVVALLSFFAVVEIMARLQKSDAARWAGFVVRAGSAAARGGFGATNWPAFAAHPLDALRLWQGGFLPAAGWAGGIAVLLAALDGQAQQLAGRDRPVVLNLWATWCPPCRREMPMMTKLAANISGVDFVFANQGEDAGQVRAFLENEDLPTEGMVRDPRNRLMTELDAIGLPATLVFDARGRMVAAHTGEISRAALTGMIASATGD